MNARRKAQGARRKAQGAKARRRGDGRMLWMPAAIIGGLKLMHVFKKWIRSWKNYRGAVIHAMGALLPVKVMPLRCQGRKPCC
jgi:hypothetical protein